MNKIRFDRKPAHLFLSLFSSVKYRKEGVWTFVNIFFNH